MTDNTVKKNKVVSIEYSVHTDEGALVDTTEGRAPLQYLHGSGHILPKLEAALEGMEVGESKEVMLEAEDAYGEKMDVEEEWIPIDVFPEGIQLEPGMALQGRTSEGQMVPLYVKKVEEERILVDYNHPLAGKRLNFDVEVQNVREATDEELSHGHAHSEGHHH